MNDNSPGAGTAGPRRALDDLRRPREDRAVAGVCTGLARHFDVDPVVVRIAFVVFAFIGFSSLIVYAGLWFFLPEQDGPSVAARWFSLDDTEYAVRQAGLVVTGVLAAGSAIGDLSTGWFGPHDLLWIALVLGAGYWLIVVLPRAVRQRRADPAGGPLASEAPAADEGWASASDPARTTPVSAAAVPAGAAAAPPGPPPPPPGPPPGMPGTPPGSPRTRPADPRLTILTLSVAALVAGILAIVDLSGIDVHPTTYTAAVLGIVGVGLVAGAFLSRGGTLILVGLLVTAVLAVQAVSPFGRAGQQVIAPTAVQQLASSYSHGTGEFRLDLSGIDPQRLAGRSIAIETGVGKTEVVLPDGLDADVRAQLGIGDIQLLGRQSAGAGVTLHHPPTTTRPLRLDIDSGLGQIEVKYR